MLQTITAAVTKSVQKAGIIAGQSQHDTQSIMQPGGPPNHAHPDQHPDNELSQTVTTVPPDEAQQRTSSTTTLNSIDSVQLPAMLCYLQTQPKHQMVQVNFLTQVINL